jgi:hypothetical protein
MLHLKIKNIIRHLAKFAFVLLALIVLEGVFTLGTAFKIETYTWFGWMVQSLLLILCLHLSIIEWE